MIRGLAFFVIQFPGIYLQKLHDGLWPSCACLGWKRVRKSFAVVFMTKMPSQKSSIDSSPFHFSSCSRQCASQTGRNPPTYARVVFHMSSALTRASVLNLLQEIQPTHAATVNQCSLRAIKPKSWRAYQQRIYQFNFFFQFRLVQSRSLFN